MMKPWRREAAKPCADHYGGSASLLSMQTVGNAWERQHSSKLETGRRTGRSLPGPGQPGCRGRKVRTPQGSVPDNVRDAGVKARGRPVPQKTYRLWDRKVAKVRVKRCGKSAPLRQQWRRQGKPHTEQDQIGREARAKSQARAAHRPDATRRLEQVPKPPGRSLMSVRGNAAPRGMTA